MTLRVLTTVTGGGGGGLENSVFAGVGVVKHRVSASQARTCLFNNLCLRGICGQGRKQKKRGEELGPNNCKRAPHLT